MKKLVLIVVFVFAIGSIINATSSNKEYIKITSETEEIYEDFGCANDCVRRAKAMTTEAAEENGDSPNDDSIYLEAYNALYTSCYNTNC